MGWCVIPVVQSWLSALHDGPYRFPFLFYSTTYVGQVMAYQLGQEPDIEIATRTGEFAMLLYSIGTSLVA